MKSPVSGFHYYLNCSTPNGSLWKKVSKNPSTLEASSPGNFHSLSLHLLSIHTLEWLVQKDFITLKGSHRDKMTYVSGK